MGIDGKTDPTIDFYSDFGVSDKKIPMHTHDRLELVLVKKGFFTAQLTGNRTLCGERGDVFIFPSGVEHDQGAVVDGANVFVLVSGINVPLPMLIHTGSAPLLMQWFDQLPQLSREKTTDLTKEYFFKALWQRLTTFFSQNDTPFHPALLRAVKVIRTRFMHPYSADTIARHAGLSRSHLNALFHKQFACGITAYINSLRLEYAKELLSNPYLNIGEAAGRSGFPDANYFSRIFRKKFGLSPGEFREQLRTGTLINYEYSPPAPEPEFPTPGGGLHK